MAQEVLAQLPDPDMPSEEEDADVSELAQYGPLWQHPRYQTIHVVADQEEKPGRFMCGRKLVGYAPLEAGFTLRQHAWSACSDCRTACRL